MTITRPMLSGKADDLSKLKFPVLASPKLDGFRCLKLDGKCLARSFKPIPNDHVRNYIEKYFPDGLDGELMLAGDEDFNKVSSAFRKQAGEPDFVFWVFDLTTCDSGFQARHLILGDLVEQIDDPHLKLVEHKLIHSAQELEEYERQQLVLGFEGVMVRSVDGPYKCGRSTAKEGYLLKLKQFVDSEAEVIGFEEQMHNENTKEKNELGLSKRSTHKENMIPAGTLGKFLVRDIKTGVEFGIGTGEGLTHQLRQEIWDNQDQYMGEIVKYKYQPHGTKNKPRIPIWLGFRAPEDMS